MVDHGAGFDLDIIPGAVSMEEHVVIARRNQGKAVGDGVPVTGFLTLILQRVSRRWAKLAVNWAGMCWTTTTPGAFSGNRVRTLRMASVPPVEAPRAMSLLVVTDRALEARIPFFQQLG